MTTRTLTRRGWLFCCLLLAGSTAARPQVPALEALRTELHDWSFELPSGRLDVHFLGVEGMGVELTLTERPETGEPRRKKLDPSTFLRDASFFRHGPLLVGLLDGYSVDFLLILREPALETLLEEPVSGPSRSPSGRYVVAAEFRPLHLQGPLSQPLEIFDLSRAANLPAGVDRETVVGALRSTPPRQTRLPSGSLAPLQRALAWERDADRFAFVERVGRTFIVHRVALDGGVLEQTSARIALAELLRPELPKSADTLEPSLVQADALELLDDRVEITFLVRAPGVDLKKTIEVPKAAFR